MIVDKITNLKNYYALNDQFKKIDDFIKSNDLNAIDDGSYEISEGVKVNISEYNPGDGGDFECHRCFHDLQYAIKGDEIIEVISTEDGLNSTGYKPDIEFFKESSCKPTSVSLNEGTFVFLTPGDAHKPCIKSETELIKKAVFKIKI